MKYGGGNAGISIQEPAVNQTTLRGSLLVTILAALGDGTWRPKLN